VEWNKTPKIEEENKTENGYNRALSRFRRFREIFDSAIAIFYSYVAAKKFQNSFWDCYGSFDEQRLFSVKFARFRNFFDFAKLLKVLERWRWKKTDFSIFHFSSSKWKMSVKNGYWSIVALEACSMRVWCSVLQCGAVCCSATHMTRRRSGGMLHERPGAVSCSVVQCVTVCCSVLQCDTYDT